MSLFCKKISPIVSVPAPAPVSAPSCWTEQDTVWETQYVDTVTQECRPVTKQECSAVTKVITSLITNIQMTTSLSLY